VSFFPALPDRDRPDPGAVDYRSPEWLEPPQNEVPVAVALNVVLARTDQLAAWVAGGRVYSNGLSFDVEMVYRQPLAPADQHRGFLLHHGLLEEEDPRFGVAFADGRRTALDADWRPRLGPEPPAIVLGSRGGGGGGRGWSARLWLWPLPPEGPLTFALKWERQGIGETLVQADSAPLRAAATGVTELWPDDRPLPPKPDGPAWSAYGSA
jgi:hypothetical protein